MSFNDWKILMAFKDFWAWNIWKVQSILKALTSFASKLSKKVDSKTIEIRKINKFLINLNYFRIDKNPQRSSGFHISDILQLNNQAPPDVKPRSPMDYSVYNYNDYPSRQHYYSTYHPQILPSTLTSFESDLPFYSTTFGSAPTSYNGNIYFPTEPASMGGFVPSQMIPASLSTRFLMNDANNNSFGEILTSFQLK